MTIAPWPEWLPDQADFGNTGSPVIKNCIPLTARTYGPMPTAIPLATNTLAERCQGSYSIKAPDGTTYVFAGDRQKLYMMPSTGLVFADVSRLVGGAYATPSPGSGGAWSMTSYGSRVLATNGYDAIQSAMIPPGGTPNFVDLSATAPKAKYIATVKDFVFVGNTNDAIGGPIPYRCWWSGINDPANWPTPGSVTALQVQSDYQDLQQTNLGAITGLQAGFAAGSDIAIFCEKGIYTGLYAGPPLIFSFRVAQGASGTMAPLSIVQSHARDNTGAIRPVCYYLSQDGFAAFDGVASIPIGAQKFDRAFFTDLDDAYLNYVQGTVDPRSRSILWAYASVGSGGLFNRLLIYNWELGRASIVELEPATAHIEWFTTAMYATSYSLDQLDPFGDLDHIQPSLDDPYWSGNTAGRITLFDNSHRLNIAGGPPMAPTLETAEMQPNEGRRAWVDMVRPLIDGGVATVAVGHRERLTDPVVWEPPVSINVIGECPQRTTGRYIRYRMEMPAGQAFRQLQGLDIVTHPEATLR